MTNRIENPKLAEKEIIRAIVEVVKRHTPKGCDPESAGWFIEAPWAADIQRSIEKFEFDQKPIIVGYWKQLDDSHSEFPDPTDYVWPYSNLEQKVKILRYLDSAPVIANFRGMSRCRICKCNNGSQEMSDGKFVWPSGLAHYVREHNVHLPENFLLHILNKTG